MESLVLNPQSKSQLTDYMADNDLMPYESGIFKKMLKAAKTQQGKLRKRIILKVNDFQSAYIQAKFLAKKGGAEFRVESQITVIIG